MRLRSIPFLMMLASACMDPRSPDPLAPSRYEDVTPAVKRELAHDLRALWRARGAGPDRTRPLPPGPEHLGNDWRDPSHLPCATLHEFAHDWWLRRSDGYRAVGGSTRERWRRDSLLAATRAIRDAELSAGRAFDADRAVWFDVEAAELERCSRG